MGKGECIQPNENRGGGGDEIGNEISCSERLNSTPILRLQTGSRVRYPCYGPVVVLESLTLFSTSVLPPHPYILHFTTRTWCFLCCRTHTERDRHQPFLSLWLDLFLLHSIRFPTPRIPLWMMRFANQFALPPSPLASSASSSPPLLLPPPHP
ncbi:hypothetical protein BP00DRAFT_192430 [Aspergillus indologenus CBS 114.80]|uniref:Uncharacterized protein n=1 Tax=Aspergillus indologenus CBS 114.80 TaxID=1450541 RepID=A0A2V5I6Q2_9EURO|nr:hypothetical protein BP00DRAFT_192430 [Aspergillus indologenus CBS 114.80]